MNHQLNSTYHNAVGPGDENAQETDLVIGEIAQLVNDKPLTVIQTIEATTNKVFIGKTYGDLTRAVGSLLKTNTKFASAMITLVYLNNGLISHEQVSAASMGDFSVLAEKLALMGEGNYRNVSAGGMDMITAAIGAVGNITGGSLQLAAAKANAKGVVQQAELNLQSAQAQAEATATSSQEGTKQALLQALGAKYGAAGISGKTLLIILVILGLGGLGVYMLSRSSTAPALAARPNMPQPVSPAAVAAPAPAPAAASSQQQVGGNIPPLDGIITS